MSAPFSLIVTDTSLLFTLVLADANIEDARRQIGGFMDTIYNRRRLHSALG